MKIAVASRSFAGHAVLRAELLARYPDATFTDSPSVIGGDELVAVLRGHDAAIVGLERIDDAVLDRVPELRIISKYGVGLDGVDVDAIARRGIRLGWTGGVNRRSVAELTLSFAIALLHRVPEAFAALRHDRWGKFIGRQLTGKTWLRLRRAGPGYAAGAIRLPRPRPRHPRLSGVLSRSSRHAGVARSSAG
jgi:phosphoglycerate dehydrogenase-like enzyme